MKLIKAIILAMILSSCGKEKLPIEDSSTFNDPDWIRIEINNGKEAHAIFGNLDDTLVVSTLTSVYQTINKGKTWVETKVDRQPVYGFLIKTDTVFALSANSLKNQSNQTIATYSSYFTLDNGSTWKNADQFKVSKNREQEYATVHPDNLTTIKLKENLEPINGNSDASYVLKSNIEVIRNGSSRILSLPFNNQITNLYLDQQGRLYVSATSALHDQVSGKYLDYEKTQPAVVYISKKNIETLIN